MENPRHPKGVEAERYLGAVPDPVAVRVGIVRVRPRVCFGNEYTRVRFREVREALFIRVRIWGHEGKARGTGRGATQCCDYNGSRGSAGRGAEKRRHLEIWGERVGDKTQRDDPRDRGRGDPVRIRSRYDH